MKLWMIALLVLLIYGMGFVWPLKKKIFLKIQKVISNDEILKLARAGDADAVELKKRTYKFLVVGIVFVLLFILEKYKFVAI